MLNQIYVSPFARLQNTFAKLLNETSKPSKFNDCICQMSQISHINRKLGNAKLCFKWLNLSRYGRLILE